MIVMVSLLWRRVQSHKCQMVSEFGAQVHCVNRIHFVYLNVNVLVCEYILFLMHVFVCVLRLFWTYITINGGDGVIVVDANNYGATKCQRNKQKLC